MFNFLRSFRHFDVPLQITTFLLAIAGMALLYSVTSSIDGGSSIFWKQVAFLGLGAACYFFFAFFDYHSLAKTNRIIYIILVILLAYILVFGSVVRGGRRWINLGFFGVQPAEFAKIVVLMGLARLLHFRRGQINSWPRIVWSLLYALVPAGLILLEPDLGSASVLLAVWAGMLLLSPIRKKYILILLAAFIAVSGVTWKYFLKDFQRDRVLVFINPALDPRGRGYNVKQATIAVGSGQLVGSGLGRGVQSQNKFLPEQQTDFIFAASSEQVGFLGSIALLGLYLFLFLRLLLIAKRAKDDLGMYLAGGVFFLLFWHVLVNVGMNIGILPVTGIPLPFISAGGSSLLVTLIALGIAQNVARQSKALRF